MIIYFFRNPDRLTDGQLEELSAALPLQQQEILSRMKNRRHRCEQIVAYVMLCHAMKTRLKRAFDADFHIMRFDDRLLSARYVRRGAPLWRFGEHGKPYNVNCEEVFFNISHCNEAVAVAVSGSEVGIDVEGRRRYSDNLLQRAFSVEEQSVILSSDDPQKEFACLWTRKEAWFKYTGTGILMEHLKSTEADARAAGCAIVTMPIASFDRSEATFWLSVASRG